MTTTAALDEKLATALGPTFEHTLFGISKGTACPPSSQEGSAFCLHTNKRAAQKVDNHWWRKGVVVLKGSTFGLISGKTLTLT
jgi:hypothetical protein